MAWDEWERLKQQAARKHQARTELNQAAAVGDGTPVPDISMKRPLVESGRNKLGKAIETLVKARRKLDHAKDPGHPDAFGSSDEAHKVLAEWRKAVHHRRSEVEKVIEEIGGLYAGVQISAQRYFQIDQVTSTRVQRIPVSAADVTRYQREYSKDPADISPDGDEGPLIIQGAAGSNVTNKLNVLEGHNPRRHLSGSDKNTLFDSAAEGGAGPLEKPEP